MITVPLYDTKTGQIIEVAPGVRDARLKWDNASKTYYDNSIRGRKGRYLPAEEAPQKEVATEEKPKRTRRTTKKTD